MSRAGDVGAAGGNACYDATEQPRGYAPLADLMYAPQAGGTGNTPLPEVVNRVSPAAQPSDTIIHRPRPIDGERLGFVNGEGETITPADHVTEGVVVVAAENALLTCPESETRWACPYISDKTNKLTVFTRLPLTPAEVAYGLQSCLVADGMARLEVLMRREDDKHETYLRSGGRSIR